MTHLNSISCGQGAPSLFMIVMAGEGMFPADLVVYADTGWERDMLWNTGKRSTGPEFFAAVTQPLAARYGIEAVMVRTRDKDGKPYPDLQDAQRYDENYMDIDIPLFGSEGGRLSQSCTSKWKRQGIKQELRRRGATTATCALGLHRGEMRRMKLSDEKWLTNTWPLIDMAQYSAFGTHSMGIPRTWNRAEIEHEMARRNLPYLVTTECDGCPHKNWSRWQRTSPTTIEELAKFEAGFHGEFFLTDKRVPLKEALELMAKANRIDPGLFDQNGECSEGGYCFA